MYCIIAEICAELLEGEREEVRTFSSIGKTPVNYKFPYIGLIVLQALVQAQSHHQTKNMVHSKHLTNFLHGTESSSRT